MKVMPMPKAVVIRLAESLEAKESVLMVSGLDSCSISSVVVMVAAP